MRSKKVAGTRAACPTEYCRRMVKHERGYDSCPRWPRWWRLVVVGLSTLILCSCRSAGPPPLPDVADADPATAGARRAGGVSPLMAHADQGAYAPRSPYD